MPLDLEKEKQPKTKEPIIIAWADVSNGVAITLNVSKKSTDNKPMYKLPFKISKNLAKDYTTYSIAVPNDYSVKVNSTETDTLRLKSTNEEGQRKWKFVPHHSKFVEFDTNIDKGHVTSREKYSGWEKHPKGGTPFVSFFAPTTAAIRIKSIDSETKSSKGPKRPLTDSDGFVKQKKICKRILPLERELPTAVPIGTPKSLGPSVPILNESRSFTNKKPSSESSKLKQCPSHQQSTSTHRSTKVPNGTAIHSERDSPKPRKPISLLNDNSHSKKKLDGYLKSKQKQSPGFRRSISPVPNGTKKPCEQKYQTKPLKRISNEHSHSKNKSEPVSQKPKQTQSSRRRESISPVLNGTSTSCEEEEDRTLLTLRPLSDNDTLYRALSVALGKKHKENVPKIPNPDPFCWQCHECIKVKNGERQGKECKYCQVSFCRNCLDKKPPKSDLEKNTHEEDPNDELKVKFPKEMPQMEPECKSLISPEWLALLAQKRVCYNCVDRVAHALFNRTLGFMTSDYERREYNVVFNDVVTLLKDKIAQEDDFKKISKIDTGIYNKLTKVSKEGHRNVVAPMTLKIINKKALNHEYRSTVDFVFDIDLILHNLAIEKGASNVRQKTIDKIHEFLQDEFEAVDTCVTCYRNYYLTPEGKTDDNGIEVPCSNPHSIVWAKWKGKYWLPGKVQEYRPPNSLVVSQKQVYVQFFVPNSDNKWQKPQVMDIKDLYLYSNNKPPQDEEIISNFTKYQKRIKYGKELVQKFCKLLNLFYDNNYEVPMDPVPLTDDMMYIPIGAYHEDEVQRAGFFTQNAK